VVGIILLWPSVHAIPLVVVSHGFDSIVDDGSYSFIGHIGVTWRQRVKRASHSMLSLVSK
jgi:hypothetical protein